MSTLNKADLARIFRNVEEFARDLAWAVQGIPVEAVQWWRDGHRWTRDRGHFEVVPDGNHQSLIWVDDPDYTMWRRLGFVTDALLLAIAVLVVFLAVAAVTSVL